MVYKLNSWAYYSDLKDNESLLICLLDIDGVTKKIDKFGDITLYYEWNSPEDLERLLHNIKDECYKDYGWKPEEVVIDPYHREIILRDFYLE